MCVGFSGVDLVWEKGRWGLAATPSGGATAFASRKLATTWRGTWTPLIG
jgi:hypothetical protein